MIFNEIDLSSWSRKPYFDHFLKDLRCTYSMTVNVDITRLLSEVKMKNMKLYPVLIHMISTIVNRHEEYRTCFNAYGKLGYFDEMSPTYTIFHKDTETFSNIWTQYDKDISVFYERHLEDVKLYGEIKKIASKPHEPDNVFPVSCVPWVSYSGFNLNVYNDGMYLLPIFTMGKYFMQDGKTLLPLTIQHHHAVADGFHVSRFFNEFQELTQIF